MYYSLMWPSRKSKSLLKELNTIPVYIPYILNVHLRMFSHLRKTAQNITACLIPSFYIIDKLYWLIYSFMYGRNHHSYYFLVLGEEQERSSKK